jgi:hypothetical protein
MANNRELSQFGSYVTVDDTDRTVGVATTVRITVGGLFVDGITTLASAGGITTTGGTLFTKQLNVSGVSTLGNTVVGGATTQLIVNGDARITGILTIGTSSVTFDGTNNKITVGSATTIDSTGFFGSGDSLTSLNASNISSGTLPDARFPATLPAVSGANLTAINASNLGSGTIPDARFPATLPAVSGASLTAINASNLGSGTIPDARFPATLPAVSGANLTNIPGFVAGTLMLFQQTAAPTGWTKQTTHNDKTLRVVSGTASSGGSTAFTSVFASKTPAGSVSVSGSNSGGAVANQTAGGSVSGTNSSGSVSAHTLSTDQIPSHSHGGGASPTFGGNGPSGAVVGNTGAAGGGGSHTHSFTNPTWSGTFTGTSHGHTFTNPTWSGSASFTGTALDFAVQYVDLIIASKN